MGMRVTLTVEHYENPPDTYDAETRRLMKSSARKWQEMLKKEFYEEGNAVGRNALYLAVKRKHESSNDYPTKNFVGASAARTLSGHCGP